MGLYKEGRTTLIMQKKHASYYSPEEQPSSEARVGETEGEKFCKRLLYGASILAVVGLSYLNGCFSKKTQEEQNPNYLNATNVVEQGIKIQESSEIIVPDYYRTGSKLEKELGE